MSDHSGNGLEVHGVRDAWLALLLLVVACTAPSAPARPRGLCVSPGGAGGCFATIGAAVGAATPGQAILVGAGTYHEMVAIHKPLTLIGNDSLSQPSVIDAAGLDHGFYVSGLSNGPVTIRDFEIRNADHEGVLAENSSQVILESNYVHGSGAARPGKCPGAPPGEEYECGAGIHLRGVMQSTVLDNELTANQGGLLISDETGVSGHNLIAHNTVRANPHGCGIILSSRVPCRIGSDGAMACGGGEAHGVFANVISANAVESNGFCGIGIFAQAVDTAAFANVVSGNIIRDNTAGGVVLRGNGSASSLRGTALSGNIITANGAAPDVTRVPAGIVIAGPVPSGTQDHQMRPAAAIAGGISISQNAISDEGVDILVDARDGGDVNVFLNDLLGGRAVLGVSNSGRAIVSAMGNYWGCAAGPGTGRACSSVRGSVLTDPSMPDQLPTPIISLTASAFLDAD